MFCISLLSLLVTFAMPWAKSVYQKNRLQARVNALTTAILFARNTAFSKNVPMTLSPLPGTDDWSRGMILFVDNPEHRYSSKDHIIQAWQWQSSNVQVQWQGFQSKRYLTFSSHLQQSTANGHFLLSTDSGLQKKVYVTRLARVWSTFD